MNASQVSVSVVSHGQAGLVRALLSDLNRYCSRSVAEILVTENLNGGLDSLAKSASIPIRIVRNPLPKGFGANHNHAFGLASGSYYCVANPDIRLQQDPFENLVACMESRRAALVAPRVVDENGAIEDNARFVPTPLTILEKALGVAKRLDYPISNNPFFPDWVAGMFMLFKREAFAQVGGFDERYYLYYEDVDICARLRLAGHKLVLCPSAVVTHAARRESHRNPAYLRWHLASMFRFFSSATYSKYRRLCRNGSGGQRGQ